MTVEDDLRPTTLSAFIGQKGLMAELAVEIAATLKSDPSRPMYHVLLGGPPGAGKTSLAALIAKELNMPFLAVMMPLSEDNFRAMRSFKFGVLFIDEIHRGTAAEKEELLSLLETGYIYPAGQSRIYIPNLCVIGATTERTKLSKALRDRFHIKPIFEDYSDADIATIGAGMAVSKNVIMTPDDMRILATAAQGTPRAISSLVLSALSLSSSLSRPATALEVLKIKQLTLDGLRTDHIKYLRTLEKSRAIGLKAMSEMLDADEGDIREMERHLVRLDLIEYGPRGRRLTSAGFDRVDELKEAS